jgi:hypothetical protein
MEDNRLGVPENSCSGTNNQEVTGGWEELRDQELHDL